MMMTLLCPHPDKAFISAAAILPVIQRRLGSGYTARMLKSMAFVRSTDQESLAFSLHFGFLQAQRLY